MKTFTKISVVLLIAAVIGSKAQSNNNGSPQFGNPQGFNNPNNYTGANNQWGSGYNGYNGNNNYNGYNNYKGYKGYKGGYGPKKNYGGINVIIGGGYPNGGFYSPNYGYGNYCGNYYYNSWGYNLRRASRYSIQMAGAVINDAVAFNSWNDIYSPLLAKAIRHYQYSRQLFYMGNYNAALNHSERARYLASYSFNYFQNQGGYYNDGFGYNNGYGGGNYGGNYGGGYGGQYPDPYSDPYNPYYKQSNPSGGNTNVYPEQDIDDDTQFKKPAGNGNNTAANSNQNTDNGNELKKQQMPKDDAIDKQLPGANTNDKELIQSFKKSDVKSE